MEGGLPEYFENPILTKSGEERYIIWHNSEVREQGQITGTISYGLDITDRRQSELAVHISESKYRRLHESMMDGFIQTTMDGKIEDCNDALLKMLGYTMEEIASKTYMDLTPKKWAQYESDILNNQILPNGFSDVYEKEYIRKDGSVIPVELRTFLIKSDSGENQGMWAIVRDISDRKLNERILEARVRLVTFSFDHSLDELLETFLNEAENLTGSQISFSHFVNANQETLSLQNWSKRTKSDFCTAKGKGDHYPISQAGVWVDCIHERKPVIHNDYASLPHRKGLPEGHAQVVRELVVPVMRGDKLTAIFGVGNKPSDYTQQDVDTLSNLANLAWDIAERKRTEAALQESEEHFQKIFNISPICIALVDQKFRFMEVNRSFTDFTGYSSQELLNLSFPEITHPENRDRDMESVRKLITGELPVYQVEKRYIRKDNTERWGNAFITPIFDINRNFRYFLVMVKDIQERKMAEAEIQKINQDLKEMNIQKDRFFSIIAHDLKSPFNAIVGFSQLLKEQVSAGEYQDAVQFANVIYQTSERAMNILVNLLDWSRATSGRMEFNPKLFDLTGLIMENISIFDNIAGQKSIIITRKLPPSVQVNADRNMIHTVLRNLISNAIKFTNLNGEVAISVEKQQREVMVSVTDSGIGIPGKRLGQLFHLDECYSTPGTMNEKGTGLGLILCKEFVEKHGGKMQVASEEGKGSSFSFTIPFRT
jgi:PAS domain S-box-containing protein